MAAVSDEKSYKCDFCTLKLENYHFLSQHLHQFHNIVLMQCDYCPMAFPSKSELFRHVNSRHTYGGKPRLECSVCPGTYLTLKGLVTHVRKMHKKTKEVHDCKVCKKKYKSRSSLLKHGRLAHGPLSYLKCQECPKLFCNRDTLKVHEAAEHQLNSNRAQCMMCAASYKYRSQLRKHELEEHYCGEKKIQGSTSGIRCNICTEFFSDKTELLKHRKAEHKKALDIFKCQMCPAVFKLREAFENHIWDEHGLINDEEDIVKDGDYIVEDFVDFETTMMQNYELKQLIKIRKQRKFFQKLVIVTYSQNEVEDKREIDIEDSEIETVRCNINGFFNSLVGQQLDKRKNVQLRNTVMNQSAFLEVQITERDELIETDNDTNATNADETLTEAVTLSCKECEEKFNDEDSLNEHVANIHKNISQVSDETNVDAIEECDSSLTTQNELKIICSKRTKTLSKPTFSKQSVDSSSKHNTVSANTKLQCDYCEQKFKTKKTLSKHKTKCKEKTEEVNVMYPCEYCKALFPCAELLLNHCSWQHKM